MGLAVLEANTASKSFSVCYNTISFFDECFQDGVKFTSSPYVL